MSRCAAGRACYILRYFFFIMIPPYCVCSRLLHQSVVDKASWAAKWAKSSSVYIAVRPNWTLTMADFATFTQQICFSSKIIGSLKRSGKFGIGCWIRSARDAKVWILYVRSYFFTNETLGSWTYLSSLLGGFVVAPTQKWWKSVQLPRVSFVKK